MPIPVQPLVTFARVVASDLRRRRPRPASFDDRLNSAIDWLARAQDMSADDGVSYGYTLRGGWGCSYRETSGYILTTFYRVADAQQRPEFAERAERICNFLCNAQNADGSISNPRFDADQGFVFDTAQVLFGLVTGTERTGAARFRAAAKRAGDWLTRIADERGVWTRSEFRSIPHVYNTRSSIQMIYICRTGFADSRLLCTSTRRRSYATGNTAFAVAISRIPDRNSFLGTFLIQGKI
jgi:hypothetical protein